MAACARRLYDNGVWRDGRARYAADGPEDALFWDDAAVALGTLCRRSGPVGHEWAPPGTWNKPYDFIGAPSGEGLAISYQDVCAPPPADEAGSAPPHVAAPAVPAWEPGPAWRDPYLRVACVEGSGELFPDAAWLG